MSNFHCEHVGLSLGGEWHHSALTACAGRAMGAADARFPVASSGRAAVAAGGVMDDQRSQLAVTTLRLRPQNGSGGSRVGVGRHDVGLYSCHHAIVWPKEASK